MSAAAADLNCSTTGLPGRFLSMTNRRAARRKAGFRTLVQSRRAARECCGECVSAWARDAATHYSDTRIHQYQSPAWPRDATT